MSLAKSLVIRASKGEPKTAAGYDPAQYVSPWTKERDSRLISLRAQGKTQREIAEDMGITEAAVRGRSERLRIMGIDVKKGRL